MLKQLQQTIDRHAFFASAKRVLVAVSGGADSVALLHALYRLQKKYALKLTVAHLNHGIRGKTADRDEAFVKKEAKKLNLPCAAEKIDVPDLAKQKKISLEMAAREARHEFLERTRKKVGADAIAVAHTADDQAETILMRLARGAGAVGLGGMNYKNGKIVRPLLDVTRNEIEDFLTSQELHWREDVSNHDPKFLRNKIRHQVLPYLEKTLNPKIREALIRTATILRDENEWLEQIVKPHAKKILNVRTLRALPTAERRRVLVQWLHLHRVEPEHIDFEMIERIEHLLKSEKGTQSASVSGLWTVFRSYDELRLKSAKKKKPTWRMTLKKTHGFVKSPTMASFARERVLGKKLELRSWRPGDRMKPFGMTGFKKVQDIFTDLKIPRDERSSVPLLICDGEIIWIYGYRIAAGWGVADKKSPSLSVEITGVGRKF